MGMKVQHDRAGDQLHLIFVEDRIIATQGWCAANAIISLAYDGSPIEITILRYYTERLWLFTEHFVEQYGLGEYVDDLRLVWAKFFAPPEYAIKTISYEGPDGEEIVVSGVE